MDEPAAVGKEGGMADERTRRHRPIGRGLAAAVVAVALVAGCGDDAGGDPDPGPPGGETELDGGEAGVGNESTTTSTAVGGGGGSAGGATEGNQIPPGDTTPMTAQDADGN
jgi:hypothetical protein